VVLEKAEGNPIIQPNEDNPWEAWQVFNPGAVLIDEKVHLIYRAVGQDGISRFGYASSENGLDIKERLSYPIFKHKLKKVSFNYYSFASGGSFGGSEDPRLTRVGKEPTLYILYTACDEGLRIGLTSIKIVDFLQKKWKWSSPKLISPPGQLHKNWVIFPEKIAGKYAILHSINPEISIAYLNSLNFKKGEYINSFYSGEGNKKSWDNWIRGAGPPPLKTKYGWLLFYHAMDKNDPGKYKVGAMILDLNQPEKILYRSKKPILEPEKDYEMNGFKAGVAYASGAAIKENNLLLYYGAADSYICAAQANLEALLQSIINQQRPIFKLKKLFNVKSKIK